MTPLSRPRVVIVGAGFAGLWAARTLAGSALDVTIVDRQNYHTFLPLLYQVAAAELEPEQIAYPVRGVFRGVENVRFVLAEVERAEPALRQLVTSAGVIDYDFLLLGLGSVTNHFGVAGAREHSFGLKSLEEGWPCATTSCPASSGPSWRRTWPRAGGCSPSARPAAGPRAWNTPAPWPN